MRACPHHLALLLAVTAAGCLSSPEGKAQSWPPPGPALTVGAIVAGDLDGDGKDDLAVVAVGSAGDGAGVYLLAGGVDVGPDRALASFSRVVAVDLAPPVAAAMVDTGAGSSLVLIDGTGDDMAIAALDADLSVQGTHDLGLGAAPAATPAWLQPVGFPGGMPRLVIAVGGEIRHVDPHDSRALVGDGRLDVAPIPAGAPGNAPWQEPQTVTTYDASGVQMLVATSSRIARAAIPTVPPQQGGMFTWTDMRNGAPWRGQLAIDLGTDRTPDVVGVDGDQLCAVDTARGGAPTCVPSQASPEPPISLTAVGPSGRPPDLVLLRGSDQGAALIVHPGVLLESGQLRSMPPRPPVEAAAGSPRLVAGRFGGSQEEQVLVVGQDGAAFCWRAQMTGLAACGAQ